MGNKAKWLDKLILFIYVAGFLALTLTLAFTQPARDFSTGRFLNPPDESDRFLVPMYIVNHGELPTGLEEEVRVAPYGVSYALYTVLPYIFQAGSMKLLGPVIKGANALLIAGRLMDVLFGFIMCFFVYGLSKELFEDKRFMWAFCFGVMYWPQVVFIHSYINTDSCALLSVSIILYALVKAYKTNFDVKNSIILSLGIILCAGSYYNSYGYILCSVILFTVFYISKKNGKLSLDYKPFLKYGILISVIVLAGIGWWFVRSILIHDGDMLGLKTLSEMKVMYGAPELLDTYEARGESIVKMLRENGFFSNALTTFIAAYGSVSILSYGWVYKFFKLFMGVGAIGAVYGIILEIKNREPVKKLIFHLNMVVCMVIPVILLIDYAYTMDYQAQGRYILPALIPVVFYMIYGIEALSKIRIKKFCFPDALVVVGTVVWILGVFLSTLVTIMYSVKLFTSLL